MKKFFFLLVFLIAVQSCQVFSHSQSYRLDFSKLVLGDTVRVIKKDFEGFAVIKDSVVYVVAKFKADSSKLAKLKIVGTLISL